jgi:hypothetical protein
VARRTCTGQDGPEAVRDAQVQVALRLGEIFFRTRSGAGEDEQRRGDGGVLGEEM